jgi:predicted metalloprotease
MGVAWPALAPRWPQGPAPRSPANDAPAALVATALRNTEVVWARMFQGQGNGYREAKRVLFSGQEPTACGLGHSAMGPLCCPGSQKVNIDLDFSDTLEQGDIDEALNAASQIGDDNLQPQSRGTVVPESFTHGTSAQRVTWFKRGLQSGSLQQCDTFNSRQL